MENPLFAMIRKLQAQNAQLAQVVEARETQVADQAQALQTGEAEGDSVMVSAGTPLSSSGLSKLIMKKSGIAAGIPSGLQPGNVGDINSVIWPFDFPFGGVTTPPASSQLSTVTITQEAAFIWLSISKAIFSVDGFGNLTYIDPEQPATGDAPGLQVSFRDSSSSRVFQAQPISLDHIGSPRYPTILPTPMLVLPNATLEAQILNNHAANTYKTLITFHGYRMRVEDAQRLLSLVGQG